MPCGSSSVHIFEPEVKRHEIPCCGLKLGFDLLHPELLAESTLVRTGEGR
jgi:hypothetical protein